MLRRDFLVATGLAGLAGLAGPTALSATDRAAPDASSGDEADLKGILGRAAPENTRALPGILMHFLIPPADTGGSFALIHARGRKGMEPRPHVHTHEDEIVRLHEGRIRFDIGGDSFEAGAGDVVFMPRRVPHGFELLSDTITVDLIVTPGDFAEYFWRFSRPAEGNEIPAPPAGPPPPEVMEAMTAEMAERGIYPAG